MKTNKRIQHAKGFMDNTYYPHQIPSDKKIRTFPENNSFFPETYLHNTNVYDGYIPQLQNKAAETTDLLRLNFSAFENLCYGMSLFQRSEIVYYKKPAETFELLAFGKLYLDAHSWIHPSVSFRMKEGMMFKLESEAVPYYSRLGKETLFEGLALRADGSFPKPVNAGFGLYNCLPFLFQLPKRSVPATGILTTPERMCDTHLQAGRAIVFNGRREYRIQDKYILGNDLIYKLQNKVIMDLPEDKHFPVNNGEGLFRFEGLSEFNRSRGYFNNASCRTMTEYKSSLNGKEGDKAGFQVVKTRITCGVNYSLEQENGLPV
ncbi:MAG: hypothetical protein ACHQRM_05820 [Bacteroidia bacterium]